MYDGGAYYRGLREKKCNEQRKEMQENKNIINQQFSYSLQDLLGINKQVQYNLVLVTQDKISSHALQSTREKVKDVLVYLNFLFKVRGINKNHKNYKSYYELQERFQKYRKEINSLSGRNSPPSPVGEFDKTSERYNKFCMFKKNTQCMRDLHMSTPQKKKKKPARKKRIHNPLMPFFQLVNNPNPPNNQQQGFSPFNSNFKM